MGEGAALSKNMSPVDVSFRSMCLHLSFTCSVLESIQKHIGLLKLTVLLKALDLL